MWMNEFVPKTLSCFWIADLISCRTVLSGEEKEAEYCLCLISFLPREYQFIFVSDGFLEVFKYHEKNQNVERNGC